MNKFLAWSKACVVQGRRRKKRRKWFFLEHTQDNMNKVNIYLFINKITYKF